MEEHGFFVSSGNTMINTKYDLSTFTIDDQIIALEYSDIGTTHELGLQIGEIDSFSSNATIKFKREKKIASKIEAIVKTTNIHYARNTIKVG